MPAVELDTTDETSPVGDAVGSDEVTVTPPEIPAVDPGRREANVSVDEGFGSDMVSLAGICEAWVVVSVPDVLEVSVVGDAVVTIPVPLTGKGVAVLTSENSTGKSGAPRDVDMAKLEAMDWNPVVELSC
jgi:hypothetical protein